MSETLAALASIEHERLGAMQEIQAMHKKW